MYVCHVCRVDQKQKLEGRDRVQARAEGWSPSCLGAVRGSVTRRKCLQRRSRGTQGLEVWGDARREGKTEHRDRSAQLCGSPLVGEGRGIWWPFVQRKVLWSFLYQFFKVWFSLLCCF